MLGRLIVHDRVSVESTVLPRYFNHSSFASLRRQLNYFHFVRLGKGRQRESTYINNGVVELDDILLLKRRSAGRSGPNSDEGCAKDDDELSVSAGLSYQYVDSVVSLVHLPICPRSIAKRATMHCSKRRRFLPKPTLVSLPRVPSPVNNFISDEDDHSECKKFVALDLTMPTTDDDVLAGCSALLWLAGKGCKV
jgi:HSF-type DNA-binding